MNARPITSLQKGKDDLFIEPDKLTPDVQRMLDHNRERFANHFNYADEFGAGNANSYDHKGNYICGDCNQADRDECLLLEKQKINRAAGGCREYEIIRAGDPEMRLYRLPADVAAYGVAKNGKGFGCKRCPYSKVAKNTDSEGRKHWCGYGGFHNTPTACCAVNGAETMPLVKSGSKQAVSTNIKEMMHAGHPQAQAVAAAMSNARKYGKKFATGGAAGKFASGGPSWEERSSGRALTHEGMIHSPVPGRTDALPITVGGGSYVVPADHLAALGQGNSTAGGAILNQMLGLSKKGGLRTPRAIIHHQGRMKMPKIATGGAADGGSKVPIVAAGGEFVIPPDKVREIGGGDLNKGHKVLDHWVLSTRKKHIHTLKHLKPPKT